VILQGNTVGGVPGTAVQGKQVATGVFTTAGDNKIIVTGLAFKPTRIIFGRYNGTSNYIGGAYMEDLSVSGNFNIIADTNSMGTVGVTTSIGGFTLSGSKISNYSEWTWVAIE
jgi:hypothetical protein